MPAKYAIYSISMYIRKEIYAYAKTHKSLFASLEKMLHGICDRLSKIRDDLRDLEDLFWQKAKRYCFIMAIKIQKNLEKRGEARYMYFMQMCSCLKICLWITWQYLAVIACWNGGYMQGGFFRYHLYFRCFICFWCVWSKTGFCIAWLHILC